MNKFLPLVLLVQLTCVVCLCNTVDKSDESSEDYISSDSSYEDYSAEMRPRYRRPRNGWARSWRYQREEPLKRWAPLSDDLTRGKVFKKKVDWPKKRRDFSRSYDDFRPNLGPSDYMRRRRLPEHPALSHPRPWGRRQMYRSFGDAKDAAKSETDVKFTEDQINTFINTLKGQNNLTKEQQALVDAMTKKNGKVSGSFHVVTTDEGADEETSSISSTDGSKGRRKKGRKYGFGSGRFQKTGKSVHKGVGTTSSNLDEAREEDMDTTSADYELYGSFEKEKEAEKAAKHKNKGGGLSESVIMSEKHAGGNKGGKHVKSETTEGLDLSTEGAAHSGNRKDHETVINHPLPHLEHETTVGNLGHGKTDKSHNPGVHPPGNYTKIVKAVVDQPHETTVGKPGRVTKVVNVVDQTHKPVVGKPAHGITDKPVGEHEGEVQVKTDTTEWHDLPTEGESDSGKRKGHKTIVNDTLGNLKIVDRPHETTVGKPGHAKTDESHKPGVHPPGNYTKIVKIVDQPHETTVGKPGRVTKVVNVVDQTHKPVVGKPAHSITDKPAAENKGGTHVKTENQTLVSKPESAGSESGKGDKTIVIKPDHVKKVVDQPHDTVVGKPGLGITKIESETVSGVTKPSTGTSTKTTHTVQTSTKTDQPRKEKGGSGGLKTEVIRPKSPGPSMSRGSSTNDLIPLASKLVMSERIQHLLDLVKGEDFGKKLTEDLLIPTFETMPALVVIKKTANYMNLIACLRGHVEKIVNDMLAEHRKDIVHLLESFLMTTKSHFDPRVIETRLQTKIGDLLSLDLNKDVEVVAAQFKAYLTLLYAGKDAKESMMTAMQHENLALVTQALEEMKTSFVGAVTPTLPKNVLEEMGKWLKAFEYGEKEAKALVKSLEGKSVYHIFDQVFDKVKRNLGQKNDIVKEMFNMDGEHHEILRKQPKGL